MKQQGWRLAVKRALDRTTASAALIVMAPVIAGVAAAIRVTMGSPVLFRQERPGKGNRRFHVCKFRTMNDVRGSDGLPLSDAERLMAVGRLLRATSLDELPQLWNVLRGEMSLVGPRPLLAEYVGALLSEQARRHEVLPGITGWAQINGRNALSWEEKFSLDVWYVDNWSLGLDALILAKTLLQCRAAGRHIASGACDHAELHGEHADSRRGVRRGRSRLSERWIALARKSRSCTRTIRIPVMAS